MNFELKMADYAQQHTALHEPGARSNRPGASAVGRRGGGVRHPSDQDLQLQLPDPAARSAADPARHLHANLPDHGGRPAHLPGDVEQPGRRRREQVRASGTSRWTTRSAPGTATSIPSSTRRARASCRGWIAPGARARATDARPRLQIAVCRAGVAVTLFAFATFGAGAAIAAEPAPAPAPASATPAVKRTAPVPPASAPAATPRPVVAAAGPAAAGRLRGPGRREPARPRSAGSAARRRRAADQHRRAADRRGRASDGRAARTGAAAGDRRPRAVTLRDEGEERPAVRRRRIPVARRLLQQPRRARRRHVLPAGVDRRRAADLALLELAQRRGRAGEARRRPASPTATRPPGCSWPALATRSATAS